MPWTVSSVRSVTTIPYTPPRIAGTTKKSPSRSGALARTAATGSDGRATTLYRARNAEQSPLRYSIDAKEQFDLMRRIEDEGEELVAIYHSHTGSPAYPSQTDVNLARWWPGVLWLICSLAEDEPVVRGFAIHDGRIEEVDLVVE